MNLSIENWTDFILGGAAVAPIVAIIALIIILRTMKWK